VTIAKHNLLAICLFAKKGKEITYFEVKRKHLPWREKMALTLMRKRKIYFMNIGEERRVSAF